MRILHESVEGIKLLVMNSMAGAAVSYSSPSSTPGSGAFAVGTAEVTCWYARGPGCGRLRAGPTAVIAGITAFSIFLDLLLHSIGLRAVWIICKIASNARR